MIYVNLLPWREQFYPKKIKKFLIATGVILLIFSVISLSLFRSFSTKNQMMKQTISTLLQTENTLNIDINQRATLQRKIHALKNPALSPEDPIGINPHWLEQFMIAITEKIPPDVWLTHFSVTAAQWKITGKSPRSTSIMHFYTALIASKQTVKIENTAPYFTFDLAGNL